VSESQIPARRRFLVIDDQPNLVRAIKRMLADFEVTTAGSAKEALALVENGERFDVILCDLMMPEQNGMDLHAALAKVAPDQIAKMVFMTGGAFTDKARVFFETVPNPTIEKPFDKQGLLALVAAMIR
jgi:CheY-like chemotaxis protein